MPWQNCRNEGVAFVLDLTERKRAEEALRELELDFARENAVWSYEQPVEAVRPIAQIASPWPLDARVPSYWLPSFLKAWDAGHPIIDANFEANSHVRQAVSPEPRDYLAMNIYGDPLQAKGA